MTDFRFLIIGALTLAACAPITVYASEVTDEFVEWGIDDVVVEDEEGDQPADPDPVQSEVYDSDSDPVAGDLPADPESDGADIADEVSVSGNEISDVSGNDIDYDAVAESIVTALSEDYGIMPLSDYDTYYGSISSTYLEYMRGYLYKLAPGEHYVASRVGQYEYVFAYGESLVYSGSSFSGSDITTVIFNTQSQGSFSSSVESSFTLYPGSYLVYTDLSGSPYPSLSTSSDFSLRQIVYVIAMMIVFYTLSQFMRSGVARVGRRRRR